MESIEEVLDVIVDLEALAGEGSGWQDESDDQDSRKGADGDSIKETSSSIRAIDLVIVSHEFTDHMHQATLLEVPPSVPIFATSAAYTKIKRWNHFTTCIDMGKFHGQTPDWRRTSHSLLPNWLSVTRLDSSQSDVLNYHSAILIIFAGEAVIYTPHGITPEQLQPLTSASPAVKVLALIHTMHDIRLSGAQLNLGAHNGLKVQRMTRARYWVGTHDEVKTGFGIVSWVLRRKVVSLGEALRLEVVSEGEGGADGKEEELRRLEEEVGFVELGNGESFVLE